MSPAAATRAPAFCQNRYVVSNEVYLLWHVHETYELDRHRWTERFVTIR
jgi:hypothetical protein